MLLATQASSDELAPKNARWQIYPSKVRDVVFDKDSNPWFVVRGGVSIEELKKQVEGVVSAETRYIVGAQILLIDSLDRIWLRPDRDSRLLMAYDRKTKTWTSHRNKGGKDKDKFSTPGFESKQGVLYFGGWRGVNVLKDGDWTYQDFMETNVKEKLFYSKTNSSFQPPTFVQDDDGNVYAWSKWGTYGWTGTVGYFKHDGQKWTHHRKAGGQSLVALNSVTPMANGDLLICPKHEYAIMTQTNESSIATQQAIEEDIALLAADKYHVREAAQRRLFSRGAGIVDVLEKEFGNSGAEQKYRITSILKRHGEQEAGPRVAGYMFSGGRCNLVEKDGTVWLYVSRAIAPDGTRSHSGFWRISPEGHVRPAPDGTKDWCPDGTLVDKAGRVYFARYRKGCVRFEDENVFSVTDDTQSAFRYVLGEDKAGRIYLSNERNIAAWAPDQSDVRHSLPTVMYEIPRGTRYVTQDSFGRIWAKLKGQQWLSVFDDGDWCHHQIPDGRRCDQIVYMQPLKEGWLIVGPQTRGPAYLFDGKAWTAYEDLRDLVAQKYDDLKEKISNQIQGQNQHNKLVVDSEERIWLVQWRECHVHDGDKWYDVGDLVFKDQKRFGNFAHCLPIKGSAAVILGNSGLDYGTTYRAEIAQGKIELERIRAPDSSSLENDDTTRSGLWIDSKNELLIPSGRRDNISYKYENGAFTQVANTGSPRFEDSDGDIWYLQSQGKKLVVGSPNGETISFAEDSLHRTTAVVEPSPGRFFVGTTRGLLELKKEKRERRTELIKIRHYDKSVPLAECLGMFVGADDALWFYGPGPRDYRLWRVDLRTTESK